MSQSLGVRFCSFCASLVHVVVFWLRSRLLCRLVVGLWVAFGARLWWCGCACVATYMHGVHTLLLLTLVYSARQLLAKGCLGVTSDVCLACVLIQVTAW